MIDDPIGTDHTGGVVSAPVFANVMAAACRLLGIPADNLDSIPEARRDRTLLEASAAPASPINRDSPRNAALNPIATPTRKAQVKTR